MVILASSQIREGGQQNGRWEKRGPEVGEGGERGGRKGAGGGKGEICEMGEN